MTATLRVVLDQLSTQAGSDLAMAQRELSRALLETAPRGCIVSAIAPAADADVIAREVPGLSDITKVALARRELVAGWQLGVGPRIGGGLIHAASIAAPLVKHDRIHNNDQTVITIWDLTPWQGGAGMSRPAIMWHKAMLKRAEKHADAVVVPTHAMAEQLRALSRLGSRVRVITGSAPERFGEPTDAVGLRRALGLPEQFIVVTSATHEELRSAFAAILSAGIDSPIVVLDTPEGHEPGIIDIATAVGLPESRVHARGILEEHDRAAVLAVARVVVAPSYACAYPWRVLEAMTLGVPVVASASAVHEEVVFDGGILAADENALGEGLAQVTSTESAHHRFSVLSADRGRGFSWRVAAESVWALHAEL